MTDYDSFRAFGFHHWIVLLITVVLTAACLVFSKQIREAQDDRWFCRFYALMLFVIGITAWVHILGGGLMYLPLQLCDLALFLTVIALMSQNKYRVLGELAFFWGLSGSTQALLTPDLREGFPSFTCFNFFAGHAGVVLGVLYLAVRGRLTVTLRSVWRVFFVTNLYVAVIGLVNWQLGTNFGYLARKPEQPSLLDYLGPWPIYIFWTEFIGLGLFFFCYVFYRWIDRLAGGMRDKT